MLILISILVLAMIGNALLQFSVIGSLASLVTSQGVLLDEIQHQSRITRRALVQLLNPPEQTVEERALDAIVNSPAFAGSGR